MTNDQKAELYDDLVYRGGLLERKNSQLKAQHAFNMRDNIQKEINENQRMIGVYNQKLSQLMNG